MKFDKFTAHESRWKNCQKCKLGCLANKHVFFDFIGDKNNIDILLIGEAPGKGEDSIGKPFVGASGHLLRNTLEDIGIDGLSFAITNTVCCKPQNIRGGKIRQPSFEEMKACKLRLEEFIRLVKPKMVILVGSVSRDWLTCDSILKGIRVEAIIHPAYILYNGGTETYAFRKWRQNLVNLLQSYRGITDPHNKAAEYRLKENFFNENKN